MASKLYFTILIFFIVTTNLLSNELDYSLWLEKFKIRAEKSGISKDIIDETLNQVKIIPRVIELDRKQPEFTLTLSEYLNRVISKQRKKKGISKIRENWILLENISKKYNVQPRFIVALWGIETDFGRVSGGFPVIDSLVTLAYDGRRGEYFSKELLNALKIIDEGHISYDEMVGSWAGAMGQTQFMPSSYHAYAVDYDQDGRKDIWSSKGDIFASIANYLRTFGWKDDQTWGREVILPKYFDFGLTGLDVVQSISAWQDLGVRRGNGDNLPVRALDASIVLPDGGEGAAYMVYQNFRTTLKWNRSIYFALSVGILADGMLGH